MIVTLGLMFWPLQALYLAIGNDRVFPVDGARKSRYILFIVYNSKFDMIYLVGKRGEINSIYPYMRVTQAF